MALKFLLDSTSNDYYYFMTSGIIYVLNISFLSLYLLDPPPQKQSMGLLASLTAKIAPNKSHNQQQQQQHQNQQQQQQQQSDYDRSRNEPIYQQRNSNQSNQYYDTIQQQQSNFGERQSDGKNQIYSQSSNHQYQHQYSIYNQNIYVSTNPFITPPISSFGKDTYSSNVLNQY